MFNRFNGDGWSGMQLWKIKRKIFCVSKLLEYNWIEGRFYV